MKNNKNKKAFTLSEIMITMMVLGFIIVMSITNAKRISPDQDKAKFIKAYSNIEKISSQLVNDEDIYPGGKGFKDLSPVELLDPKGNITGEAFGMPDITTKFRDAFKHNLHVVEDNIECYMWNDDKNDKSCFRTDEGIVYGIPKTDFEKLNMQKNSTKVLNSSGNLISQDLYVLPIAIYTNWEKKKTAKTDAFFVGVSYAGKVKVIHSSAEICTSNPEAIQCKAEEFLKSDTLKRTR